MKYYKIVIVNYNKSEVVKSQLRQLSRQTLPPASVSIVDNSPLCLLTSQDFEEIPFSVELSHYPENLGYSKACNLGADGQWDYVVFLNPDIEIQDESLFERLISRVEEVERLGCAGVAQLNPDGSYERVARKFPSIPAILGKRVPALKGIFARSLEKYLEIFPCDYAVGSKPVIVDWLQSSFLLVPRSVWKECGSFDERFFVFMADAEYGLRCKRNNLNSYLFRDLMVKADGMRSSAGGVRDILHKRTIRIHIWDALRYYTGL